MEQIHGNVIKLNIGKNNKENNIEIIKDNAVYTNKSKSGYKPGFYYLIAWNSYLEKENTWKLILVI